MRREKGDLTAGQYYEQFKKQREEKQKEEAKKEEAKKEVNEDDMFDPLSYLCA